MKCVVDAHLPRRLATLLSTLGDDAVHTKDLGAGNRTTDRVIREFADAEGRIVISKDSDFVESFLIKRSPARLLLVSTGNIHNDELLAIFRANHRLIVAAFADHAFVEIDRTRLILHE